MPGEPALVGGGIVLDVKGRYEFAKKDSASLIAEIDGRDESLPGRSESDSQS